MKRLEEISEVEGARRKLMSVQISNEVLDLRSEAHLLPQRTRTIYRGAADVNPGERPKREPAALENAVEVPGTTTEREDIPAVTV